MDSEEEEIVGAPSASDDIEVANEETVESEEQQSAAVEPPSRWVCDACGCHTNASTDRTCTICGSHPSGPTSAIRRIQASVGAGGGSIAGYAARAGWLARGLGGAGAGAARRAMAAGMLGLHNPDDELSMDDDDLWESVMHGVGDFGYHRPPRSASNSNNASDQHPDLPMLMDIVNGGSDALSRNVETSRQRYLEAARAYSIANREAANPPALPAPPPVDAEALMQAAIDNAPSYQPVWTLNPSTLVGSGRSQHRATRQIESRLSARSTAHGSNEIQVGECDQRQNLAHVPPGASEGRAIRAQAPLPRDDQASGGRSSVFASFRMPSAPTTGSSNNVAAEASTVDLLSNDSLKRRVFGFRVAFDYPTSGDVVGANMGGCYLVGVTTASFTAYGDQDALRQSPFFWGIEDGGQVYEGPRHHSVAAGGSSRPSAPRRSAGSVLAGSAAATTAALYALDGINVGLSASTLTNESPLNARSVLFGANEVVTVVCDLDLRTLTFWRDQTLLGTLVTNLPRNGQLYPVAVPFNCAVTVAITGLDGNPLDLLQTFSADLKKLQLEKDEERRNRITKETTSLILNGKLTDKLRSVLQDIFLLYADASMESTSANDPTLPYTSASRLWYRCGLTLSNLDSILENQGVSSRTLRLYNFLDLVEKVVEHDKEESLPADTRVSILGVSDFVIGDRVELEEGFEKYGDAAGGPLQVGDRGVVVELQRGPNDEIRSVRVFHSGRRWYYQPQAIVSERSGLVLPPAAWFISNLLRSHGYDHGTLESIVGTTVTTSSWRVGDIVSPSDMVDGSSPSNGLVGHLMIESPSTATAPSPPRNRQGGTVTVEFVGRPFAEALGIKSHGLSLTLETRKVHTSKLLHTTHVHASKLAARGFATDVESSNVSAEKSTQSESSYKRDQVNNSVREKVMADIEGVGRLELSAIESVTKECRKGSDALASLFCVGLPDAVMSALDIAERQMNSLETKDDLAEKLAAVGGLANEITEQLFGERKETSEEAVETDVIGPHQNDLLQNLPQSIRNQVGLRTNDPAVARREVVRAGQDGDPEDSDTQLQQRRNLLMSLVSRASNRANTGSFLNDLAEVGIEPFVQVPRAVGQIGAGAPFAFGSSAMLSFDPQTISFGNPHDELTTVRNDTESTTQVEPDSKSKSVESELSFLDSILRHKVGIAAVSSSGRGKHGSNELTRHAEYALCARQLSLHAILPDSVDWAVALVDKHSKKGGASLRSSSLLRNLVDEGGTSLLLLAISFGCSTSMINRLISWGAPVQTEVLQKAAVTNQPKALAVLLQHTSYKEGTIDLDACSTEVFRVVAQTKSRQNDLDKKMRNAAGEFMFVLLRRVFELGLASRRMQTSSVDMCSKVILKMLVGNFLLRALQCGQNSEKRPEDKGGRESTRRSDIFLAVGDELETALLPQGLLGSLPNSIVADFIMAKASHLTTFMLLCEDYLCSKDAADVAAGLALLSVMLTKFPEVKVCPDMLRFGMSEFISNHSVMASNRIADILSKQLTVGLDVGYVTTEAGSSSEQPHGVSTQCLVQCPKKHTATLHITIHSSFRCDICGCAVPKGEYIFGCRQCDYDECLHCTLRDEKRTLGVHMMIREFASDCTRILGSSGDVNADVVSSRSNELDELSIRLLKRDVLAVKDLGTMLSESGRISIHEFISVILPALHDSLIRQPQSIDRGPVHRNKKARASLNSTVDSTDARIEYCREALRAMTVESRQASGIPLKAMDDSLADVSEMQIDSIQTIVGQTEIDDGGKLNIRYSPIVSEILRRLHQVISFYESVPILSTSVEKAAASKVASNGGDLQSLTKPFELHLLPSDLHRETTVSPKSRAVVYVEPLILFSDLHLHVLRTYRIIDPLYMSFCVRLASDDAMILERPMTNESLPWRIAHVVGYNKRTGAHSVRYSSGWKRGQERKELRVCEGSFSELSCLRFYGAETSLVLATRQYYILYRKKSTFSPDDQDVILTHEEKESINDDSSHDLAWAVGTRVESSCGNGGKWAVMTLVDTDKSSDSIRYVLVSDEGELFYDVSAEQIRTSDSFPSDESTRRSRRQGRITESDTIFPFFASTRHRSENGRGDIDSLSLSANQKKALKRTWSALSLLEDMRPVDLNVSRDSLSPSFASDEQVVSDLVLLCRLDDAECQFHVHPQALECSPRIQIHFSTHEKLPAVALSASLDRTLICALKEINQKQQKWTEWPPKPTCLLYFSASVELSDRPFVTNVQHKSARSDVEIGQPDSMMTVHGTRQNRLENRSRKFSSRTSSIDGDEYFGAGKVLCDGVDEICIQCMEVISLISECAEDPATKSDREVLNLPGFANPSLSSKLSEQLDDVLCGVGAALPDWCLTAASFAPSVFSYESRRMLLERAAFGPSRSTLKQQEAKVNVGRLRQRMTSLRARAVELVGEAFSGGADDPTALQLQADELYGMEEALATRVRAAFRAMKWQEHTLQVAKAAVCRDRLLADAAAVMNSYANDRSVCRRRLEVRFEGESGFDAASGDEAGVTRGYYADVAEALVSTDNVAGVYCSSTCSQVAMAASTNKGPDINRDLEDETHKLPLWIPDMDSSAQVILPSPRADKKSGLGIFPRPIPHYHPQFDEVLQRFRLMGRLFAAAMRDGFMFPLPLSSAFLKLVQNGKDNAEHQEAHQAPLLQTSELPRPGFLGGEVYAIEFHICRALDNLNALDPPLSRHELKRRYEEIATDKNFARVAFGKSYDCSFEEFVQDRTFVDPLDPAQDASAVPLCPKGHAKPVTIFNVRDWVVAAKHFMLHDGVIQQAVAFREGINDFFSADFLRIFTSDELQRDVCGAGDDVDNWNEGSIRKLFKLDGGKGAAEALVAVAAIGGEGGAALSRRFGPSSPTIAFLVKALLAASSKQRRQFLSFVTSVPIVTPGRIEVVPILSPNGEFLPMRDPSCLPRANTCSRRLYLPKFETFDDFSEVLWAVVGEESKFKGFYEWRGT